MEKAQMVERRAATLARIITAELMRPTGERAAVTRALVDLDLARGEASGIVALLRRALGTSTVENARAARGGDDVAAYAKLMRTRLRAWDKVLEAAQDCVAGREWPLVAEQRPRLDVEAAQDIIMARVFTWAHRAASVPQSTDAHDFGCFPDIPLSVGKFMLMIHLAYRLTLARKQGPDLRFIDVGCGGGLKVALASQVFAVAEGIDYDPAYVEVAERNFTVMRMSRCAVRQADGLTFEDYGKYDVIYFYQPMSDVEGLKTLERKIVGDARDGTILLAPYEQFANRAASLGCRPLGEAVYIKGLPEDQVEPLLAEAGRMGPHITDPDRPIPIEAGWLRSLWLACQANGIDPHWPPRLIW
jgi:SAM-dependent methyltransferase